MSFSLGGVTSGVVKGLQYDLDFVRAVAWAIKTKNTEALSALEAIAVENAHEIAGEAQLVTQTQAIAILFNSDPFHGSRQLMQAFTQKYGKH